MFRCPAPAFGSGWTHWAGRLAPSNPTVVKETQHLPFSQEQGANRITCVGSEDAFSFSTQIDKRKLRVPGEVSKALFNDRISAPIGKCPLITTSR